MDLSQASPSKIRQYIREGQLHGHTSGLAKGYVQANVVILPSAYAYDFLRFCFKNPKTCPLLDVSEVGDPSFPTFGNSADIRTDVAKYNVYENGTLVSSPSDITHLYNDDLVSFLIGCSFTFEHALLDANIPVRHIEEQHNVPMYVTNITAASSGVFNGPITVSMRPMTMQEAIKATEITTQFKNVHGTPIHIGNPQEIGIENINKPDFGEAVSIYNNEVPVFWGCGVTPQSVALEAKPSLMITHAPGHMFITDIRDSDMTH